MFRAAPSPRSAPLAARSSPPRPWAAASLAVACAAGSCADSEPPLSQVSGAFTVYSAANACVTLSTAGLSLARTDDGAGFAFRKGGAAARLRMRASDLATYLLRDAGGAYVVASGGALGRAVTLQSDTLLNDDSFVSPAEWTLEPSSRAGAFHLKSRATGGYLAEAGLSPQADGAAAITLTGADGCSDFPELSLDALGDVTKTHFADGTLFGVVDAHSHLFTNLGFGGGGVFHGSVFHRLGVEHALPDCAPFHGEEGRNDVLGYYFGGGEFNADTVASSLITGTTPAFDHHTEGYPRFTDWPRARHNSTHQTQYHRWLERAYKGGLRLVVQLATSNQVLCELVVGIRAQQQRFSCNEMFSAERELAETYALERYLDAQAGGPGRGWLRVVTSPGAAREVIGQGKLAVVLGIETSNVLDCRLVPRPDAPACDAAMVRDKLDHLRALGVRAMFPVHKFDNAFSAGDGNRGFIELGAMLNSGHYSNFTQDCPEIEGGFDTGAVTFGGINKPRPAYDSPPPLDFVDFGKAPASSLLPLVDAIEQPPLVGDYCQNAGLTPLGETLMVEMMKRGMIIEIDHMPRRSYARALELLQQRDYPASGSHGRIADGALYDLGGVSTTGLPRCGGDAEGSRAQLRARFDQIAAHGAYRAQGFGFDLNGFAGARGPRFGDGECPTPQSNPVTYPFQSFGKDVTFTVPRLGDRVVDFNTEGFVHVGMLPELLEDARRIGFTDDELEPIFRSAEGYLRMWERAEARGQALASAP